MTKFPAPPSFPRGFTSMTLHSKFTGDSAMSGGFTNSAGFLVNPDLINSSTPVSYSVDESETC